MNLSAWNNLINKLGTKRCAEEFGKLVDLAQHTSDPEILVQNPIYEAMLEDRLNDETRNNSQQAKTTSLDATAK